MASVTVGTTGVDVLPRNAKRMTLTVRNESSAGQKLYGWFSRAAGLTTTNADYVLAPYEEKSFIVFFDGQDIRGPVAFIASAADGTLYYAETAER